MTETAFTRMSRIRALALEEDGKKGARRLASMLEKPEQTLNVVLLARAGLPADERVAARRALERSFGSAGIVIGIVLQFVLFFVIGEVGTEDLRDPAPRPRGVAALGVARRSPTSRRCGSCRAGCIGLANVMLPGKGPKQGPFVTEDDLRTMADVAADEMEIEREERRLIHSIFEFGDTVSHEVMRPRPDMVAIDCTRDHRGGDRAARSKAGYSRLPCYEDDTDNIIGIVYLKDLVHRSRAGEGNEPVRAAVRDAVFVPESEARRRAAARDAARRSSTWRSS